MMKILLAVILINIMSAGAFAYVKTRPIVDGKTILASPLYLGAPSDEVLTNKSPTATITISTSGSGYTVNGDCYITLSGYGAPAIATANKISGGAIGALLFMQTKIASVDVGITEAGTGANIKLESPWRLLSDPADLLVLQCYAAGYWREVVYKDNN